jgi:RNA polymerase sigma factor (sigma-70 family)
LTGAPEKGNKGLDVSASTKQKWMLTAEAFEGLLAWLNPDRDRAGERYEEIRTGLINGFQRHGCNQPEELADETINRVARRLPEIAATYVGDQARYFYGVAHNVHLEYIRKQAAVRPLPPVELQYMGPAPDALEEEEPEYDCLKRCMQQLTPRSREMILHYYRGERDVKIRLRKELAARLGVKLPNLRLQAQRVRANLKRCLLMCLEQGAQVGQVGTAG